MHGTVVMLMALSGLGCHYKHADVAYTPSCYSGVADACYSSCYSSSVIQPACYSSCYSSCYSEACYSDSCYSSCYSGRKHGHFKKGFGLFHGLFKKHHRRAVVESCYSSCYSTGYAPAVFGSSMPIYETPMNAAPATTAPATTAPATTAPATTAPAGNDLYRGGQPAQSIDTPPAPPEPVGAEPAPNASDLVPDASDLVPGADSVPPAQNVQP